MSGLEKVLIQLAGSIALFAAFLLLGGATTQALIIANAFFWGGLFQMSLRGSE
jgi:hypothetical protein